MRSQVHQHPADHPGKLAPGAAERDPGRPGRGPACSVDGQLVDRGVHRQRVPLGRCVLEPRGEVGESLPAGGRKHAAEASDRGGRSRRGADRPAHPERAVRVDLQELVVAGAMPRVIRLMAHVNTTLLRDQVTHVYLRGATALRRDLAQ